MAYENITVEKKGEGIVKITLNRPHVLNALSNALFDELQLALEDIQRDDTVAVVILTGAGRAFSAGRDLKTAEDFVVFERLARSVLSSLEELGPPVIAAVNGFAITGGFELALACDIVVASESALFRDTHAQVGILPGGGNTQRLPRLIGEKKAKEIMFASEFISATEAEAMGLVNQVVPPEKLEEEVMLLARKIVTQPKDMIRKLKQMINEGMKMDLKAAMMFEQLESRAWRQRLVPEEIAQRGQAVIEKGRAEISKE